jgi:hypothetical protein
MQDHLAAGELCPYTNGCRTVFTVCIVEAFLESQISLQYNHPAFPECEHECFSPKRSAA